ncbi:Signal recognition particle subunit SRP68 isoform A [Chlorella sorokiniana]|uniref:Signal recognition particle subunit SRP68 n=1 Tax=Chlorella sorokiniana TaxID=3076 RepID=A0A2P6TQ03_CHLSO|nr:Signal recognition particle subunit SRP68 isoform A [Chlorella sorokiniana]|eukprot:PRW56110.1 Signal recognition particle subunit SRP68 isoform A [Chlorella sorokiniana]
MEAEQTSTSQPAAPELPTLTLDVLQIVKDAQSLHGLKHSDYQRYRQYCSRRLRRIYKAVRFLHGRGRYQKKKLEPEAVKDVRHLHIPLVQAERAWAYAMDLKSQLEEQMQAQKRQHLIRRLAKAARHAVELVQLTAARCDARSQLEAEAYSLWMAGSLLLEKESDWEGALARFLRARKLFEELSKVGSFEQQAVCKHFLDQVEPTIRYCQYQTSRKGGAAPEAAALLESIGGGGSDQLQSKLASIAAQAKAAQAAATSSLSWNGESYEVRDDKIRVPLHTAQELQGELDSAMDVDASAAGGELDARVSLFDRCINAYGEARAAIKSALQLGASGADSEQQRAELLSLDRAVQGLALELTIRRNLFLASDAEARFGRTQRRLLSGSKGSSKDGPRERPAKAEDVVRLYDTLIANVLELNELAGHVGGAAGEMLMDDCAAKQAHYQAARCVFVAHSLLAGGKPRDAAALFSRAADRCKHAASQYEGCAKPDVAAGEHLAALQAGAKSWATVAAAELRAGELRDKAAAQAGMEGMSLEGEAGKKREREEADAFLPEDLDAWEAFVGAGKGQARLCRIPPAPHAVPVRPIFLDTALNYIQPPDLSHRLPKKQAAEAQGTFSRLFGGWGAR